MLASNFWDPRPSFLPPIPELDVAADLLSNAADALVSGDYELARACLREADMSILHDRAFRIMGAVSTEVHRHRRIAGADFEVAPYHRAVMRMPSAEVEAAAYARDGYRCRFCGCRVVHRKARPAMAAMVPGTIRWGTKSSELHGAFSALTATIDHLVPHAKGGDNAPDNLLTTCWPCNFGRGGWLIDEVGLIDPRTRPPVCDEWDGLTRILTHAKKARRSGSRMLRASSGIASIEIRPPAPILTPAHTAWLAQMDDAVGPYSERLLAFLAAQAELQVSWGLKEVLIVRMKVNNRTVSIFGIDQSGYVEIPWSIGEAKGQFRPFAETLAHAIPGAFAYETPKMWRVRKNGRCVTVPELLAASETLRAALKDLNTALRQ